MLRLGSCDMRSQEQVSSPRLAHCPCSPAAPLLCQPSQLPSGLPIASQGSLESPHGSGSVRQFLVQLMHLAPQGRGLHSEDSTALATGKSFVTKSKTRCFRYHCLGTQPLATWPHPAQSLPAGTSQVCPRQPWGCWVKGTATTEVKGSRGQLHRRQAVGFLSLPLCRPANQRTVGRSPSLFACNTGTRLADVWRSG